MLVRELGNNNSVFLLYPSAGVRRLEWHARPRTQFALAWSHPAPRLAPLPDTAGPGHPLWPCPRAVAATRSSRFSSSSAKAAKPGGCACDEPCAGRPTSGRLGMFHVISFIKTLTGMRLHAVPDDLAVCLADLRVSTDLEVRAHDLEMGVSGFISYDLCKLAGRVPRPSRIFLLHRASMRCLVSSSIDLGSRLR